MDGTPWRVILHTIDDCRIIFNRSLHRLEPWQIVLYTMSACIFVVWVRKILKFEDILPWRKMVCFFFWVLCFFKFSQKIKHTNHLFPLFIKLKREINTNC